MSDTERARFPKLTNRQLNRRVVIWSLALVVVVIVIIVMAIRT